MAQTYILGWVLSRGRAVALCLRSSTEFLLFSYRSLKLFEVALGDLFSVHSSTLG